MDVIWYIYLEQLNEIKDWVPPKIKRIFNQNEYVVKGQIISSVRNVRELKDSTRRSELGNYFYNKRINTKSRIIGTSAMYVKIVPLNANIIGCGDLSLPEYLITSKSLVYFEKRDNNLCFWYRIAYNYTKRYNKCN